VSLAAKPRPVVRTTPKAGTRVRRGSKVAITVARRPVRPPPTALPPTTPVPVPAPGRSHLADRHPRSRPSPRRPGERVTAMHDRSRRRRTGVALTLLMEVSMLRGIAFVLASATRPDRSPDTAKGRPVDPLERIPLTTFRQHLSSYRGPPYASVVPTVFEGASRARDARPTRRGPIPLRKRSE
jgi:hypothetical protein